MSSNKNPNASMESVADDKKDSCVFSDNDNEQEMKNTAEGTNYDLNHATSTIKETAVEVNTNSEYKPMPIKKKHRRGSRRSKRRKYKPYSKLTWEEKKAIEERDSRRAVSLREKYMHEKGRPLAPFNTSQFLMAEHDTQEPDLHVSHHHHHHHESNSGSTRFSSSADDSDDFSSSLSDQERDIEGVRNFLQKDFTETYERLHSESLHRMNKEQLVNEYMQLEDKVENLEKELTVIKANGKLSNNGYPDVVGQVKCHLNFDSSDDPSRRTLELEVEKLREENRKLHLENSILRPKATAKEDPAADAFVKPL